VIPGAFHHVSTAAFLSPSYTLEPIYQTEQKAERNKASGFSFGTHGNYAFNPNNRDLSTERYVVHILLVAPICFYPLSPGLTVRLVIRALGLPNYRFLQTPNCFARITIDGEQPVSTKTVHGSKPEWNASFDM
jgi:hypothetical protein